MDCALNDTSIAELDPRSPFSIGCAPQCVRVTYTPLPTTHTAPHETDIKIVG